jgi:hypothetical protein
VQTTQTIFSFNPSTNKTQHRNGMVAPLSSYLFCDDYQRAKSFEQQRTILDEDLQAEGWRRDMNPLR